MSKRPKKFHPKLLDKGFSQDGSWREEAENVSPKVKSWRDDGDTPCRQGHWEEAKL
jgi:hypothetical protein